MLRRSTLVTVVLTLVVTVLILGPSASWAGPPPMIDPTGVLSVIDNPDGSRTLDWSLRGSSDEINVLPNLRCELGPAGTVDPPQFDPAEPCLWLVDHRAPPPTATPDGCLASREPDSGGPADKYASWRCDMRRFSNVVIHAAQNGNDRSFVMFNTRANGGSGVCATIGVTVLLGRGYGEIQAADGCAQTIRCEGDYQGTVKADALDTVSGCAAVPSAPGAANAGGSGAGAAAGRPTTPGSGSKTRKQTRNGPACPGASSGRKGNSPLYSVYIKARGKRGMVVYVHMRRAVPITVDVRMRRGGGRGTKIVRWVARCAKKGTNIITFPNATGGAQSRRNYRVIVKSPNSTYPLRAGWEALPRR